MRANVPINSADYPEISISLENVTVYKYDLDWDSYDWKYKDYNNKSNFNQKSNFNNEDITKAYDLFVGL